jgi:hypothetical protein
MTAKCALAIELLRGTVLNVKNCVTLTGLTNCAREVSRMIEKPFEVRLSRTQKEGKSRWGQPVIWINYKLPHTEENMPGILKMREYVKEQLAGENPKTEKERSNLSQIKMFI